MQIPIYQIDAFTSEVFRGNPAAVCRLADWLPDAVLQAIAAENNLSETAYLVQRGPGRYDLRWFTPAIEVDLCGHATLASAFVVFNSLEPGTNRVVFASRSGDLPVTRTDDLLTLDFPAWVPSPCDAPAGLAEALGGTATEVLRTRDCLAVFETEEAVRGLRPDFSRLREVPGLGIIVTAPGREADFVSRFFAPGAGIDEDPATGSAHCTLAPYWAARLYKQELYARQVSGRGGEFFCRIEGERVRISGRAVRYLEGTLFV